MYNCRFCERFLKLRAGSVARAPIGTRYGSIVVVDVFYSTQNGYSFGRWIHDWRRIREKIATQIAERLSKIGMIWSRNIGEK